jgi:hypothetical protein
MVGCSLSVSFYLVLVSVGCDCVNLLRSELPGRLVLLNTPDHHR